MTTQAGPACTCKGSDFDDICHNHGDGADDIYVKCPRCGRWCCAYCCSDREEEQLDYPDERRIVLRLYPCCGCRYDQLDEAYQKDPRWFDEVDADVRQAIYGDDEPEPPEYDPGPEVDDEGGMSEYRHVMDQDESAWLR